MRRRHHGIAREVRQGRVPAMALDLEDQAVAGRHHRAVVHRDSTRLQPRPVVVAKNALHRETLEQPIGDHAFGAAAALFGRLKHELDGAGPGRIPVEQRRRPQQRRRVPIVAARMHHARVGRRVRYAGGFGDRQRIHVRAQPDRSVGRSPCQRRNHPMTAHAGHERYPQFAQLRLHEQGRFLLLQRQLRVRMQVSAPSGQGLVEGFFHAFPPKPTGGGMQLNPARHVSFSCLCC